MGDKELFKNVDNIINDFYELLNDKTKISILSDLQELNDIYYKLTRNKYLFNIANKKYKREIKTMEYALDNISLLIELKNKYNMLDNKDNFYIGSYLTKQIELSPKEINLLNLIYNRVICVLLGNEKIELNINNCPNVKDTAIISIKKEKEKIISLQK